MKTNKSQGISCETDVPMAFYSRSFLLSYLQLKGHACPKLSWIEFGILFTNFFIAEVIYKNIPLSKFRKEMLYIGVLQFYTSF